MKYRKKPIIVDAFKWTHDPDGRQEPSWFLDELNVGEGIDGHLRVVTKDGNLKIRITTLAGVVFADIGDYIIRESNGEIYTWKPYLFESTYEEA